MNIKSIGKALRSLKGRVREIWENIIEWIILSTLNFYVQFCNTRNRIFNKPKLFIYTDSRGQFVTHKYLGKTGLFPLYALPLLSDFQIDYYNCPEKHTTMIDFIRTYGDSSQNYDVVVAHVGIVDFSPRHKSIAKEIYTLKKSGYDRIFGPIEMKKHLDRDLGVEYEGEPTINMFSLEMMKKGLLPYLNSIPQIIFIGCNNFVRGWEGNYFRKRPENISIVEKYSEVLCDSLPHVVDISNWRDDEVKTYTVDNIHFTYEGNKEIVARLKSAIRDMREELGKRA